MDLLSSISAIPPIYFLLLGVIFLLLIIEIVYLVKKRGGHPATSPPINPNASSPVVVVNKESNKKFPMKGLLLIFVLILIAGVAGLGYFLATRPPRSDQPRAHTFNDIESCGVKIGPAEETISGNKYTLRIPIENKRENNKRGVKLKIGRFACTWNSNIFDDNTDPIICPYTDKNGVKHEPNWTGDTNNDIKEKFVNGGKTEFFEATAEQPLGVCGMFQIDVNLFSVWKEEDGQWHDECKPEKEERPGVGGLYWQTTACGGVSPTATPSPTLPGPTATPTPTLPNQPTITPSVTPPGNTPAPMCSGVKFYSVDLASSPPNLFVKELSSEDLKNLKAGDQITITVLGTLNTIKGQYRVKQGTQPTSTYTDLTLRKPGTNEFYSNTPYTMPAGITSFRFEGRTQ
ncbi:hypothetical protein HY407_03320 [Candidatus Gottesmanbacteria bacterium]|nr:hypothetical protein [Candidatus Gottesmanbacteria bacterium]